MKASERYIPPTRRATSHIELLLIAALALLALEPMQAQAQPPASPGTGTNETFTDRIYLTNGDRISGRIKELDRGKLRVKTTTMDTVYLNWLDVEAIESNTFLRIVRTDGSFTYGRARRSSASSTIEIYDGDDEAVDLPALEIASIKPLRVTDSKWKRLEGDITAGFDYKKASDILLVNVNSNLRLREEKYELDFGFNWNETTRADNNNSSRAELSGNYSRLLRDRWFWRGTVGLERNQELGIDLRTIVSGTAGRYLMQTSKMRFEVNGGMAASRELGTDDTVRESIEGVVRSSFDLFKLNIPITRLSANLNVFPGITESGRVRVNSDITLRNELIRDLFWDLSFYSSFDNQPAEGARKDDYGVVTSIGMSW
jgi:putative salt-induced outer membrane protein YdiY